MIKVNYLLKYDLITVKIYRENIGNSGLVNISKTNKSQNMLEKVSIILGRLVKIFTA